MEQPEASQFSHWLRLVFDHPVTVPKWYWSEGTDDEEPDPEPQECVKYLTRLFENPITILEPYSDAQINHGLWYLTDPSCSNHSFALIRPGVALPQRLRAISTLFEQLYASRCTDHLCHLDEPGAGDLNTSCYMWWDVFPAYGQPDDPDHVELDPEILGVMRRTLALDSVACQESALHGLGHWEMYYPGFVQSAIDEFLRLNTALRPELREYAMNARRGYVN
jgi:hypothetical protein